MFPLADNEQLMLLSIRRANQSTAEYNPASFETEVVQKIGACVSNEHL